jgi:dTDP-4-dehydrorhamnose 3,5-epimerase
VVALEVSETPISGVMRVRRAIHGDHRGSLERIFDAVELGQLLGGVAQVNLTRTANAGTVRGLHLQLPPAEEAKLVSCVQGRVFDVAVDLRGTSPTFGLWVGYELSAEAGDALLLPPGCAHGIQTLVDDCAVVYIHSAPYATEHEAGMHPLDQGMAIDWPLPPGRLSSRDAAAARTVADFRGVTW